MPVPVDLSKVSDVVKNHVVKKDIYKAKIKKIKDKIPDITNLATNSSLNAKINEVKKEILSITNVATTTALTTETESKIFTNHDHDKHITIQELNKLTSENFTARLN